MALKSDGTIVAWGDGSSGQTAVPGTLTNALAIAAGGQHSLAIASDGSVQAWGDNTYSESIVPANNGPAAAIAAGGYQSLALLGALPVAPRVGTPARNGGTIMVPVPTTRGKSYFLEGRNSILDTNWNFVSGAAGNGGIQVLVDLAAPPGARYYRVMQQ
jgi:hypothetical protein